MKKNKLVLFSTLFVTLLLFTVACEDEDPYALVNDDKPLVVQANDFNLSLEEGSLVVGDTLGTVSGTSNRGSVNFELISQTPSDVIDLDPSNGILTVVNPDAFVANTQITGVAEVAKDGISDSLNITITVEEGEAPTCTDPIFNINLWLGALNAEDVGFSNNPAEGFASPACDQLIIAGDVIGAGCDANPQITLQFTPESDGATSGTVAAELQPWDCYEGTDNFFVFPSGTYDEITGEILVDYEFYQDDMLNFTGQILITSGCTSSVNTSIWAGDLSSEDVGFSTAAAVGTAGCGDLTVAGDLLTFGCANTPSVTFVLVPSADGSTSGTIIGLEQDYDCEDDQDNTMIFPSGTYDETTGEILVDYEYYQDGTLVFPGQFLITPI